MTHVKLILIVLGTTINQLEIKVSQIKTNCQGIFAVVVVVVDSINALLHMCTKS